MRHEIQLRGAEITFLKALGMTGTPLLGSLLLKRLGEVDEQELLDTVEGLMDMEFVVSSKVNVSKIEDVKRSVFRVNAAYADDLRESMRPGQRGDEDRARRRRRC